MANTAVYIIEHLTIGGKKNEVIKARHELEELGYRVSEPEWDKELQAHVISLTKESVVVSDTDPFTDSMDKLREILAEYGKRGIEGIACVFDGISRKAMELFLEDGVVAEKELPENIRQQLNKRADRVLRYAA